jgi:hypothetical protein
VACPAFPTSARYDTAADGRFLALIRTERPPPLRIHVVIGWDREVRRMESKELQ